MVATVTDVAATLLGDFSSLNVREITPADWMRVIRKMLNKLDLKHMRGFSRVHEIYSYNGLNSLRRVFEHPNNTLSTVFLNLADACGPPREWEIFFGEYEAPRDLSDYDMDFSPYTQRSIAVSRDGQLYEIVIVWVGRANSPIDRTIGRYALVRSIWVSAMEDSGLQKLIALDRKLPDEILSSLRIAIRLTVDDLESQLRGGKMADEDTHRVQGVASMYAYADVS